MARYASAETCEAIIAEFEQQPKRLNGKHADIAPDGVASMVVARTVRDVSEWFEPVRVEHTYLKRVDVGEDDGAHADNERRIGDGWEPNHTPQRSHTAILYLNGGLEGGEFYFTQPYREIRPEVGLLVAFPGDRYHEHGVKTLRRGRRFTMATWFQR